MKSTNIVTSLKTDGVTLVENVLSDDHCRALLDGIEWGFQNRQGPFPMLRQWTYEWFREHPILMELLGHPLVIEVADRHGCTASPPSGWRTTFRRRWDQPNSSSDHTKANDLTRTTKRYRPSRRTHPMRWIS